MTATIIDTLNALLQGELAAVETYDQALAKDGDRPSAGELRLIRHEHQDSVSVLQHHVRQHGGVPETSSGAWGSFAKAVEGTAKVFGNAAAIKALKEGEEHGVNEYRKALDLPGLPADCAAMIESKLLPSTVAHVPALDRLIARA